MTARGRLLSGLVATVIALAGFVTAGALPAAAAGSSGTLPYVALGDSYAAGAGAPPYDLNEDCKRSSKGYPALLDPKGRIDLQVNATCAGFTSTDVYNHLPAELNEDTRLVTLTVGGNDLGFADLAEICTPEPTPACGDEIAAVPSKLGDLYSNLTLLYREVVKRAPDALIVVTGYPHLVEPTAAFPPNLIVAFNRATDALNSTIQKAVLAVDPTGDHVRYVDVIDAFAGHGIGAEDDPFINATGPDAFHPNAAGYRAYAKAISAAIRDALNRQEQLA
jgi:lysophospholipase L1-like esterase